MSKTKSSSVLDGAAAIGASTMTRSKLGLVALATAGAITLGAPGAVAGTITTDPLHGYCAGAGQCVDNGTNSPSIGQPTNFGFTISPGPQTGTLMFDVLVPDNLTPPSGGFALTGTLAGTAHEFSATPWTSGDLDAYLGISASPANPIGAYLPSTLPFQPSANGFFVFDVSFPGVTLQDPSNPGISPLENISPNLANGSYIVGFLTTSSGIAATANSGAILVTPAPVIGHGLLVLLAVGGVLFGGKLLERIKQRRSLKTA